MSTSPPEHGPDPPAAVPPPASPSPPGPWASDEGARTVAPPPGAPERPPSIRTAVRLMYVGAALGLIGVLSTFFQLDAIRDRIEDSEPSLNESEVDTAVAIGVVSAVVIGLVAVGLWLWMAHANGRGQSWARVVASVLGGLSIASTLLSLATGTTTLGLVFSVITVVLAAAILFLLYRPESSRYYAQCSR